MLIIVLQFSSNLGPPEEISMPPVVGAIVGGVGALIILIVAGLVLSRYAPRCCSRGSREASLPATPPPHPRTKETSLSNLPSGQRTKDNIVPSISQPPTAEFCSNLPTDMKKKSSCDAIATSLKLKDFTFDNDNGNENVRFHGRARNNDRVQFDESSIAAYQDRRTCQNVAFVCSNNPDLVRGTGK